MLYRVLMLTYILSMALYDDKISQGCAFLFCLLFLIKLVTDNRKCSVSYAECKLRSIKKEKGFVYNSMNEVYDMNKSKYKYIIYSFIILIMLLNLKKCIFN